MRYFAVTSEVAARYLTVAFQVRLFILPEAAGQRADVGGYPEDRGLSQRWPRDILRSHPKCLCLECQRRRGFWPMSGLFRCPGVVLEVTARYFAVSYGSGPGPRRGTRHRPTSTAAAGTILFVIWGGRNISRGSCEGGREISRGHLYHVWRGVAFRLPTRARRRWVQGGGAAFAWARGGLADVFKASC